MAEPSEYELMREANIRNNEAELAKLGLTGGIGHQVLPRTPVKFKKTKKKPQTFANAKDRQPAARPKTRHQLAKARAAGEDVDSALGHVEAPPPSDDEDEMELELDTEKVVAKIKAAGLWGGASASKDEIEGSREAFKQRYIRIKGG